VLECFGNLYVNCGPVSTEVRRILEETGLDQMYCDDVDVSALMWSP
jgi:hypothetical protein